MNKLLICGAALFALAAVATGQRAVAHHAFAAEFDGKDPVKLQGPVVKKEWINPHAWIHLKDEASGKVWMVEGGPPATLIRGGLTKESLPNGTVIIVRGYKAKDKRCFPACKANGRDVTFLDGRKVFIGGSSPGAPREDPAAER
jgi:hypothetical protein